jgi:hypothetical protein
VADFTELGPFCATAETFWRNNTLPDGERVILVEAMSQDLRVTLRNLTLANALRRIVPARLVVYTGADADWLSILWTTFDVDTLTALAHAYGAEDVFDIHGLVDSLIGPKPPATFTVAGKTFRSTDLRTGIEPAAFDDLVHATAARVYRAPRIPAGERHSARYQHIRDRSRKFSEVYDALFAELDAVALVTSHVDYNHWGLAVESARRFGVPVVHVQSTGTLKAYTLFPDTAIGGLSYRGELTRQIGDYFDRHVWPRRKELQHAAELTAWRNKSNLGRPSWWRGMGAISAMEIRTNAERDVLRQHAMDRFGFDRNKPVVAVYNHAISDALNTNVEVFTDLAAWFEKTVAFAARRDDVNWLFIDHPSQDKYDATGFFDKIAAEHGGRPNLGFVRSMDLSKNLMWSTVDLGITVRGSISTELPAFGIPCIQAGWSEWSELGFTTVADDEADYWRLVDDSIKALSAGRPLLDDDQIEKARLWMWFYRSATDVPSVFVQQWELGDGDELFRALKMTMQYVETDDDPAFESVQRMWSRQEPFLTRFDLSAADPGFLDVPTGEPGAAAAVDPAASGHRPRLLTAYDRKVPAVELPGAVSRGDVPALQVVDGFARGLAVPGRFTRSPGLVGVKVPPPGDAGTLRVTAVLTIDNVSVSWWQDRVPAKVQPRNPEAPRILLVRAQGRTRTAVVLHRPGRGAAKQVTVRFDLDAVELRDSDLLVLEFRDLPPQPMARMSGLAARHALVGIGLSEVRIEQTADTGSLQEGSMPGYGGFLVATEGADRWRLRPVMTRPPAAHQIPGRGEGGSSVMPPRPSDVPIVPRSIHTLPPPEPRTRIGRWAASVRLRIAAEGRIDMTSRDQPPQPPEDSPPHSSGRSAQRGQRSAGSEHAGVLTALSADLVRERRIKARAIGLVSGSETALKVTAGGGADVELAATKPLTELSLLHVQVVEDELVLAPELGRYGVVWHLRDRPSEEPAG